MLTYFKKTVRMWLNVYDYVDPVSKQRQKSHSSSCPPSQKMPKVLSWWELRASLGFILNCCSCTHMHCGHHAEWLVLLPHTFHLPARIVCELFEGRGLVSSLVYHPKHLLVHVVTPAISTECFLCARYHSKHWGKIQPESPHWVLLRAVQDGQYYNQLRQKHPGMKWSHLPKVTQLLNSKARVWSFESMSSCLCS